MANPEALIGTLIGPYEIRKHIARGGMADVYLAYEQGLQRKVALKIMLPALAADEQFVQRFQREAQVVAQLDHPNIIHVYRIGVSDGRRPYIAMQYIEGGSLQDTLRKLGERGELIDTRQALAIAGKMAEALQVAHAAGIVHRDIKPSNILIRPDGRPVLVDLGIAAVADSAQKLTQTGTLIGTPHYMAPEQATGKGVDGRSDIYSLGIILYELLSGRRPFEATDPLAVMHAHVYEQPTPLARLRPDLSAQTIGVVEAAMQKDPNQRFQTAGEMRWAINTALKSEGGPGMMTAAGLWEPYPTGEYRLSESKIVRPESTSSAAGQTTEKSAGRWWFFLIPLLCIASAVITWQLLLRDITISGGGGDNDVAEFSPTAEQSEPTEQPTEPAEPTTVAEIVPEVPTEAELPTATFTPLPTSTPEPTLTPTPNRGPVATVIGYSVRGEPIQAIQFGDGSKKIIFIGGLHAGAAPGTVALAQRAISHFSDNLELIPESATVYIIPNANPDSPFAPGELDGRLNVNKVDLNRNWDCRWTKDAKWRGNVVPGSGGSNPFSEPETQALANFITGLNPTAVIFWEARAKDGLSTAGACFGQPKVSGQLAATYGISAGYAVDDFETLTNQELNGDGTNWLDEQGISAAAILLPEYESIDWPNNLAGIRAVIDTYGR